MNEIKQLRQICKVKQSELAISIGMEQSNYCNVENGKYLANNIPDIKAKSIKFLLPKLKEIIDNKKSELSKLNEYYNSFV